MKTAIVSSLLMGLLLVGCDKSAEQQAPPGDSRIAPNKSTGTTVPRANEPVLLVNILPEPAIADGCLRAVVNGAKRADYRWQVNDVETGAQGANVFCEPLKRGDKVAVTVSEGRKSATKTVTVENSPPKITEVAVSSDAIPRRDAIKITATAVDVDGDLVELSYQWYVNGEADSALKEGTLPKGRYGRGDAIRFTIVPSDNYTAGQTYQSDTLTIPNAPPQIVSQPPQQFEALEYGYQVKARDPDGDKLAYTLTKMPAGMTINRATGLIAWPLTGVKAGVYPLKIVVRDPDGAEAFQEFALTLGAPALVPAAVPAVKKP